jgi:SIR2-like domain
VLDADYSPSSLHRFLAGLPALLRDHAAPPLLVLTTNYDDALERAFDERGEPYDVVWYEAKRGTQQGKFVHGSPGGEDVVIERPNEYAALDARTVVLKLHGAVNRGNPKRDSYVITEDDYVGYLSRGDVGGEIPVTLRERMADSHFLFLGYSMRDWNLRVILNRIWGKQQLSVKSWAVQREPADPAVREIEETLWRDRGDVDLVYVLLSEYVAALATELSAVPADA